MLHKSSIIYQGLLYNKLLDSLLIAKTNHLENTLTSPLLDNGIHLSVFKCKERLQNDHNYIHFELWTMERKQLHAFLNSAKYTGAFNSYGTKVTFQCKWLQINTKSTWILSNQFQFSYRQRL